jgi:excisionase family DNA binding protein
MTIADACRRLGVSRTVVYRLIDEQRLHPLPSNPLYKGRAPVKLPAAEVEAIAREIGR